MVRDLGQERRQEEEEERRVLGKVYFTYFYLQYSILTANFRRRSTILEKFISCYR